MSLFFPIRAPSHGGSGPTYNTWFLGLTRVLNPNGILIGAAVFAGLTTVTDRQTTLLIGNNIGLIYVRSTAVRTNNTNAVMAKVLLS